MNPSLELGVLGDLKLPTNNQGRSLEEGTIIRERHEQQKGPESW